MNSDLDLSRKAKVIDDYFREKNYFPWVPYDPIGEDLIDAALNHTGKDHIWLSTAATVCEMEGGGKNVLGCDAGSIYCQNVVTRGRVERLLAHIAQGKTSNGIGVTQITYPPIIDRAELLGGAHLLRNQMIVGFNVLNDLLNNPSYDYLNALEAYNDGNPFWNNPNNSYDIDFAVRHRAWKERLKL